MKTTMPHRPFSSYFAAATALILCGALPGNVPEADAALTTALKAGGKVLKITGDNSNDDVEVLIDDSGANRVYVYDHGSYVGSFTSHALTKIQIVLKGGDDQFFVGLPPGASHKFTKDIDLKLGAGNDEGFIDFRGNGGLTIVQGSLDIDVNAGSGDDEVFAHFARKHGGTLKYKCNGSSGDDECMGSMWGDITGGADVSFDLKGAGGDDDLWSWNTYDQKDGAYSNIRISGDSSFDIRMNGGGGIDTLTPTFGGEADGDLTLIVNGKGDADAVYGIVSLDASGGQVLAAVIGSGGNDDLRLDVNGSSPFLAASINGGGGTDLCQGTANVSKTACP